VKGSTIPQSPNLRSHLRSRPVHYLTREEEEEKEAEDMKSYVHSMNEITEFNINYHPCNKHIKIKHFIVHLMHTNYKLLRLLK